MSVIVTSAISPLPRFPTRIVLGLIGGVVPGLRQHPTPEKPAAVPGTGRVAVICTSPLPIVETT